MAGLLGTFIRLYKEVDTDWAKHAGKHWWMVALNLALEKLCRENPSHIAVAEVYAKVRLINRAYSANLERNKSVDWPEWKVAEAFARGADNVIALLRSLRRLDLATLPHLVVAHTALVALAKKATKTWTLSFCSKYLSFHFPHVAPIYDSLASHWAKRLVPRPDVSGWDWRVLNYDYGQHCLRVFRLLHDLHQTGVERPKLRVVDFVLYWAMKGSNSA
jgi:hypothetical protein